MSKAEKDAREIHRLALIEAWKIARDEWCKGYEQAKKDLALTAEDCSIVMDAFFDYMGDISAGRASVQNTKEGLYVEVLRRFQLKKGK